MCIVYQPLSAATASTVRYGRIASSVQSEDGSMFTQPSVSAHSLIDRSHGLSFFSLVVNMSGKDVTLSLLDKVVILNRLKNGEKTDKILNEKRSFYALCSESSKTKPRSDKMPHLCRPHDRRPRPRISVSVVPKELLVTQTLINRFSFCFRGSIVHNCFCHVSKWHINR